MRSRPLSWCGGFALAALVHAQPGLQLKQGAAGALESTSSVAKFKRKNVSRSHLILQFAHPPEPGQVAELERRGARVVGYVPENALAVSVRDDAELDDLGLARVTILKPEQKISALGAALDGGQTGVYVVEFHADSGPAQMREIATECGLRIREHPDLLPHQLAVEGSAERSYALAEWDEVAYIFPASRDIAEGRPVVACAGAVAQFATVGQYVAQVGKGWAADAKGAVALQYHFDRLTGKLPGDEARAELERALKEWARHARLSFAAGTSGTASRTVNFLFASGGHGDPYPFDGAGHTLAHTFYPSPPNPEPLAGDVHFDDDEGWRIGADTDLYSVALHELGHALGLGHSDAPGTVMYPFYRRLETLTPEDEQALQQMYAPPEPGGPDPAPPADPAPPPAPSPAPPPAPAPTTDGVPPTLTIASPASATVLVSSATINLRGTARDNVGVKEVSWSSSSGLAGTAQGTSWWSIAGVPLRVGANTVTVRVRDAAGNVGWRVVVITRR